MIRVARPYRQHRRGDSRSRDFRGPSGLVPPSVVVRYDGDDTDIVVADDKGTAGSPIHQRDLGREGLWLGEALFA